MNLTTLFQRFCSSNTSVIWFKFRRVNTALNFTSNNLILKGILILCHIFIILVMSGMPLTMFDTLSSIWNILYAQIPVYHVTGVLGHWYYVLCVSRSFLNSEN